MVSLTKSEAIESSEFAKKFSQIAGSVAQQVMTHLNIGRIRSRVPSSMADGIGAPVQDDLSGLMNRQIAPIDRDSKGDPLQPGLQLNQDGTRFMVRSTLVPQPKSLQLALRSVGL